MKIAILGCGAMGGLAGAYMALNGEDVTFIDTNADHIKAIREKGIFIDGCRGDIHVPPQRAFTPQELTEPLEAVILACKTQHTVDAVKGIKHLLGPESFVMSLQNGFNEEAIASLIGRDRTVGGLPDYGGAYIDPGHLEYVHEGPVYVGELDNKKTPRVEELRRLLAYNTRAYISDNMDARIWAKEAYASQIVTTALVNCPGKDVLYSEKGKRAAAACVREMIELAYAKGFSLDSNEFFNPDLYMAKTPEDTQKLFDFQDSATDILYRKRRDKEDTHKYVKTASGFHWDIVHRKRPSEVGHVAEYIWNAAKDINFEVPVNTKLFNMILEIESGKREMGWHNIDELNDYAASLGKQLP